MAKHRILVPLDGSALAEMVMPTAVDLGTDLGADWILVQVVPLRTWDPTPGFALRGGEDRDPAEVLRDQARQYLEDVRAHMGVPLDRVAVDVRQGPVLPSLLDAITDHRATLVMMCTHGLGGVNRLLTGSITDAMVRLATVPVLIVHP